MGRHSRQHSSLDEDREGYAGDRDREGSTHGGGLYQPQTQAMGLRRSRSKINMDLVPADSNPSGDSSDGGDGGAMHGRSRVGSGCGTKGRECTTPVGAPMGIPPKHPRQMYTAMYLRAVEEGYYEKSPSRGANGGGGGGRAGMALASQSHPRMHRSQSAAGVSTRQGPGGVSLMLGGTGLDDTLNCRCSFKLPSNSQLCRIFAVMVAMIFLLNASNCGFFYCYSGVYLGGSRGISSILHSDLHDIYEQTNLAHTQANMVLSAFDPKGPGAAGVPGGEVEARRLIDQGAGITPTGEPAPLMIPRIIHQTYKSSAVPDQVRGLMASWDRLNPGWEIRFYDDAQCLHFVRTEYPEYYDAYLTLPKDVERSDFFRYLIVLSKGGVYADIDTECRKPLDRYLRAADTLVVGWENEFQTDEMAYSRHFVRRRQVLNWIFAGAPGHPALRETCDHIARHARTIFTNNTNRDTLERTGPGVFTDIVLRQFWRHSRASEAAAEGLAPWGTSAWALEAAGGRVTSSHVNIQRVNRDVGSEAESAAALTDARVSGPGVVAGGGLASGGAGGGDADSAGAGHSGGSDGSGNSGANRAYRAAEDVTALGADPWTVRVLPKVAFGTHPSEAGVPQDDPGVLVAHHFLGSWKSRKGWSSQKKGWFGWARLLMHTMKHDVPQYKAQLSHADPSYAMPAVDQNAAYPVSAAWEPPFDILTHLVGSNASDEGMTVSGAALTARGRWQPGRTVPRQPTSAEALVGSLSAHRRSAALLDVGAGLGYFSLAAAARGHRVISYEWGKSSGSLLRASITHNGFEPRVELRTAQLGGRGEAFCRALAEHEIAARAGAGRDKGARDENADFATDAGFGRGLGTAGGSGGRGHSDISEDALARVMARLDAVEVTRARAAEALERSATTDNEAADASTGAPGGMGGTRGGATDAPGPAEALLPARGAGADAGEATAKEGLSGKNRWDQVWQPGSGGTMGGWMSNPWSQGIQKSAADTKRLRGSGPAPPNPSPSYPDADIDFPCEIADEAGIKSIDDVVSLEDDIAAMRISASGWERHIIEGARRLLTRRPPPIILLELIPRQARTSSTSPDPLDSTQRLLEWLFDLGYTDVAHSGHVCDERWRNITRYVNSRGALGLELRETMRQPTWCHSARPNLPVLVARAHPTLSESILLHHNTGVKRLERERKDRLAALSAVAAARARAQAKGSRSDAAPSKGADRASRDDKNSTQAKVAGEAAGATGMEKEKLAAHPGQLEPTSLSNITNTTATAAGAAGDAAAVYTTALVEESPPIPQNASDVAEETGGDGGGDSGNGGSGGAAKEGGSSQTRIVEEGGIEEEENSEGDGEVIEDSTTGTGFDFDGGGSEEEPAASLSGSEGKSGGPRRGISIRIN